MSKRLVEYSPSLVRLAKANPALRKKLLENELHDKEFLYTVCECAKNILHGNVKLTPKQKQFLSTKKKQLRLVANKRTSQIQKKKIIQKGGFIGGLLASILPVITGLLTR